MNQTNNSHENLAEYERIEGPSNKNFGFTVGSILGAIAFIRWMFFEFGLFSMICLVAGLLLIGFALFMPHGLTRANKLWMKLGLFLFKIINPIITFLLFVICFIPMGLVMKIVGYDPMQRKFDKTAKTYWIEKEKSEIEKPMRYQF